MNPHSRCAAAAISAAILFAAPAWAQYMYLDTNGDGVHTDSDVISPTGTTTVDVWLRTDADRDGTPVSCADGIHPIDVMSYVVNLQAIDGTVVWNTFENNPPNSLPFQPGSNSTELYSGLCLIARTGPGTLRLGRVALSVASGTPSIFIVMQSVPGRSERTAFGSFCPTPDGDNTFVLGEEWFDTDGARYGGWTNPPSLAQPARMTVLEKSTADQPVNASDPDGGSVTVTSAGPSYMSLLRQGSGASTEWTVHLAPGYTDSGTTFGRLVATDGVGKDFRSFPIHVVNVNRAPSLSLPSTPCLETGQTASFLVRATDPDNDGLTFTEENVPSWVTFDPPWQGWLMLHATPPPGPAPPAAVMPITVSDGTAIATDTLTIPVLELGGCSGRAPLVARVAPNPMVTDGTLLFWTSKPGPLRVTLHDVTGRLVRTLMDEPNAPAANHRVPIRLGWFFDSKRLSSGVYFYRIEGADGVAKGRLVVLRRSYFREF